MKDSATSFYEIRKIILVTCIFSFSPSRPSHHREFALHSRLTDEIQSSKFDFLSRKKTRRSIFRTFSDSFLTFGSALLYTTTKKASAAVGTLSEFSDGNSMIQGITVDVADKSQQDLMIAFLADGFGFKALRTKTKGSVTDTWMGFGPEQLSIPNNFRIPVSSFGMYGGHASIRIRYDSQSLDVLYNKGGDAPGNNIEFLQVAVPTYRISKIVENGGNIIDAFGFVNVVSPCGLPMRGIIGISPDPMMFLAIKCIDVQQSRLFYEQLGFVESAYPYARPSNGTGSFEPIQPPGSVYLSPSKNSMGVLLLKPEKKKKSVKENSVLRSLNVVYTPLEGDDRNTNTDIVKVKDPSFVNISFLSEDSFSKEEKKTRFARSD